MIDEEERKAVGYYEKHTCDKCGKDDLIWKQVAKVGTIDDYETLCWDCQ